MSIINIKTRWLRRTVLVLVMFPFVPLAAFFGAATATLEIFGDAQGTWRK